MVRHLCAQALREVGAGESSIGDVELAVTEACANVIRHASTGDCYEVTASLSASSCEVEVRDYGKGLPDDVVTGTAGTGPEAEGGRGLGLIRVLVDRLTFGNGTNSGAVLHMHKRMSPDPGSPEPGS